MSRTSRVLVNDDPDFNLPGSCPKQSMYAVDVVTLGARAASPQDCPAGGSRMRGTAREDKESSAVSGKMPSVQLATGRIQFRPIFKPGTWSPWAAAIYYAFTKLVNFLNGNK